MNCETCNAKIPTLATRTKRVNDSLHGIGGRYFAQLCDAFEQIDITLSANGFPTMWNGTDEAGTSTSLHLNVGEGKWLHVSWHRMDSGRYEVVAYVN